MHKHPRRREPPGGGLGIEVVDVRLRRADLPEQNSQAVFQRMQTERQREAADIRAQGSQLSQTIKAKADRDVTVLRADAPRRADELARQWRSRAQPHHRGRLRTAIRSFFGFYRSMQAYEASMRSGDTRMVLSPDLAFFRYFSDPRRPRTSSGSAGCDCAGSGSAGSWHPGSRHNW